MAFKKLTTLDTDEAITIGGTDKKTGKANPKSIEGYFLATKTIGQNKFNKSKTDYMHVIQTPKGNTGVWGKTHMDRQLLSVNPGTMVRITFDGTKDVGKGNDMTCYKIEVDEDNCVAVNLEANKPLEASEEDSAGYTDNSSYVDDEEDEEDPVDEVVPTRAAAPRQPAQVPDAARQAKVKALLARKSA